MGVLINGIWRDEELPQEIGRIGEFRRADSSFRDHITVDGSSGFKAEAGRYHLYVAHGCPWAHRTLIYRALKKLEGAISVAYAIPGLKDQGWTFADDPKFPDCTPDTVNGFAYLHQAYTASDPRYTGKTTRRWWNVALSCWVSSGRRSCVASRAATGPEREPSKRWFGSRTYLRSMPTRISGPRSRRWSGPASTRCWSRPARLGPVGSPDLPW